MWQIFAVALLAGSVLSYPAEQEIVPARQSEIIVPVIIEEISKTSPAIVNEDSELGINKEKPGIVVEKGDEIGDDKKDLKGAEHRWGGYGGYGGGWGRGWGGYGGGWGRGYGGGWGGYGGGWGGYGGGWGRGYGGWGGYW